ncbi:MAG: hypothetical protein GY856_33380 [bacterium]|nr:hypothetical protein [bacterium]
MPYVDRTAHIRQLEEMGEARREKGQPGRRDVRVMASGTGGGSRNEGFGGAGGGGGDPNLGRLSLDLVDRKLRERNSFITLAEVRELTPLWPTLRTIIESAPAKRDPLPWAKGWKQGRSSPRGQRALTS